jgi:hypothetical protein
MEMSGQLQAPPVLHPGKNSGNYWAGTLVDSGAGLENVAKRKFSTLDESSFDPMVVQRVA